MTTKLVLALVLCDVVAHGLKAGQLLEAQPDTVDALKKSGEVDPHKEAVKAAAERGAEKVRSAIELRAERIAEQRQALQVEIAKLEDLLTKAEQPEAQGALQAELLKHKSALLELGAGV